MIDAFSVLGIGVLIILVLSLGRILSVVLKFVYYALIAGLVLVFFFGVSLNDVFDIVTRVLLWVF
jgi:hypothetical protein